MVMAWPDLQGCTGVTLGVADIGAGTRETSGTDGVCGFGVTGIAGAMGDGCGSCSGLADAGTEMQDLAGACRCGCCDI